MIRCEIRKLFQRLSTRIILLVLFSANAFLVWNQQLPGTSKHLSFDASHILSLYAALPDDASQALKALEQQDEALVDTMIQEKDTGILLTSDIYTDFKLFSNVIERLEPIAHYQSILNEIEENAETLILTERYEPNTFGYRNILKSREQYRGLDDVQPAIMYSGAIELLPGGRITDFILLLLCLLLGLELICTERITGSMALIKPTFRGSYPLITMKILASLFVVFLGTCILYGTNLLIGFVRCGVVPINVPIQSVYGFIRSPWKISIAMYVLGFVCMKFLWASSVTAIVCLSCCIGKTILECCGIFLLIGVPSIAMRGSVLSLLSTGDTVRMFAEYRNSNLFGWPVSSFSASILVMILVTFVCFGIATVLYIQSSPIVSDRKSKKTGKIHRISTNLLAHEARKLFLMNGAIWVLVGLMAVQLVAYLNFNAYIDPQERLYMQYSESLSGPADKEKDKFIEDESARFADLYTQMDAYFSAYSSGQIKEEAYEALCSGIQRQLEGEEAFLRAKNQYDQMKILGYDYVCQTGYERLLGSTGQRDAMFLFVQLMISLILGLSSIHSVEMESSMVLILNSVPGRRNSARAKAILCTMYAVVVVLITFVPHILTITNTYGLPGLLSNGNSVPLLRMETQTVLGGLCIYAAIMIGLAILTGFVVSLISKKTGSSISTMIVSLILLLIPINILFVL